MQNILQGLRQIHANVLMLLMNLRVIRKASSRWKLGFFIESIRTDNIIKGNSQFTGRKSGGVSFHAGYRTRRDEIQRERII